MSFGYFLGATVALMLDPVALFGWVLAGALLRRYWWALLAAFWWAIVVSFLAAAQWDRPIEHETAVFPFRVVAGSIVVSITYLIAWAIRRSRKTSSGGA